MKKFITILSVLLVILGLSFLAIRFYLPTFIAKNMANENSLIQIIPTEVKISVNKKMDEVPALMKELRDEGIYITVDDIIRIIEESKTTDITNTIENLKKADLKSTEQAIGIVMKNLDLGVLENEKVIALAKQKVKFSDVIKALRMIEKNGKPYNLTIPMGKETIKAMLLERREEIEEKINI